MQEEATTEVPHIELTPVESSQIAAIGHNPATNTLAIQFKGKGDKPGSIYHYDGVPIRLELHSFASVAETHGVYVTEGDDE